MIPEDSDHDPRSDPVSPAEITSDAENPKRREFLKSLGKGAQYAAPTLTVLTLSRESLAQVWSPPPPPGHPLHPITARPEKPK
jgi:hypothetical protein